MRKYMTKLISMILAVAVVCSFCLVSASADTNFEGHISGYGVNFRKGPSTSYAIRGVYSYGTVVHVIKELENGWCHVNILGAEGYVYGAYITRGYSPETPIALDLSKQGQVGYVNTANVNLRQGPSTSNSSYGALTKGTEVLILSSLSNGWYGVMVNSVPGFILQQYVTLGTYNAVDELITVVPYTGEQYVYCETTGVMVRTAPSSSAAAIATLPLYTQLEVISAYSNDWYGITYKNVAGNIITGYVYSYYLKESSYVLSDVYVQPVSASGTVYVIKDSAEFRTGPDNKFPTALYFKLAEPLTVLGAYVNADNVTLWYKVQYGAYIGYVYAPYVSYNLNDVPTSSLAYDDSWNGTSGIINTDNTPAYAVDGSGAVIGYLAYSTPVVVNRIFDNGLMLVTIESGMCYVSACYVTYPY